MKNILKYGVLPFVLINATTFIMLFAVMGITDAHYPSVALNIEMGAWCMSIAISVWVSVWFYMRQTRKNRDIPYYIPKQEFEPYQPGQYR